MWKTRWQLPLFNQYFFFQFWSFLLQKFKDDTTCIVICVCTNKVPNDLNYHEVVVNNILKQLDFLFKHSKYYIQVTTTYSHHMYSTEKHDVSIIVELLKIESLLYKWDLFNFLIISPRPHQCAKVLCSLILDLDIYCF